MFSKSGEIDIGNLNFSFMKDIDSLNFPSKVEGLNREWYFSKIQENEKQNKACTKV